MRRAWPVAFSHRLISPTISGQKGQPGEGGIDPDLKDEASFLYPIPNIAVEYVAPAVRRPAGLAALGLRRTDGLRQRELSR